MRIVVSVFQDHMGRAFDIGDEEFASMGQRSMNAVNGTKPAKIAVELAGGYTVETANPILEVIRRVTESSET